MKEKEFLDVDNDARVTLDNLRMMAESFAAREAVEIAREMVILDMLRIGEQITFQWDYTKWQITYKRVI